MRFIHDHFLVGLLLMSSLGIAVWAVAESDALRPAAEPIPATFFGMHIHRAPVSTPWPSVPFKAWRLWDTHTTWAQLEPRKGDWDWRMLDRTVDLAQSHGVEVLYTMGRSPRWASARPNDRGRNPNAEPGGMAEPRDLERTEMLSVCRETHPRGCGKLPQALGQVLPQQFGARADEHGLLDHVLQLPDVPRPG